MTPVSSAPHLFKLSSDLQHFLCDSYVSFPIHFTTHLGQDITGRPGLSSRDEPLMTIIEGHRVSDDMILSANTEFSLRGEKENGFEYCSFTVCRGQLVDLIIPAVLSFHLIQLLVPYLASVLVPLLG